MSKRRRKPSHARPRQAPSPTRPDHSPVSLVPLPDEPTPDDGPPGPGARPPIGTEQVQALIGVIATGGLDEHLTTLATAIHERHRHLTRAEANRAAARIAIGDRVRLNPSIRPLYLHGTTGTVVDWSGQRAVVRLDSPTGRFSTGEVRCPPLGLDRLGT